MLSHLFAESDQHLLAAGMILSGVKGILYLIGGLIAAVICGVVAKTKGYSAILFAVLGFFLQHHHNHRRASDTAPPLSQRHPRPAG